MKRLLAQCLPAQAARPLSASGGDEEPTAKVPRASGPSDDQAGLLALDEGSVRKFKVADVQRWVEAALIAGGLEGSIDNEGSSVGKVVTVLKKQKVTGAALVNLTLEELLAPPYGLALGPAVVLATHIAGLRAPKMTWKGGAPLLQSTGFDWDFQDNGIVDGLREYVPRHYAEWKAGNQHQRVHPLFVVLGPSGTGKSRTLQEMPTLLQNLFCDPELAEGLHDAYVVNLTFENGYSNLVTPSPFDPSRELGVRLMGQLGVRSPNPQPKLAEALQELARAVEKELKDMTIILTVDGIQGLPGDWTDTGSAFHRVIRVVADLVNGAAGAFVIGAVSCSTMVPGEVTTMLARMAQLRVIITPRPLVSITRSNSPVFDDDLRLLVSDMGGLGAALAALEEAINQWREARGDEEEDLSTLFTRVQAKLADKYPAYAELPKEIIGAALAGTWIDPKVDFKAYGKPAHCCLGTLVTLEYNEAGRARFKVPYVLLALRGLLGYNFDDYRERKDSVDRFVTAMRWKSFEEALASFWRMKTHILPEGRISLGELHSGAAMTQPTRAREVSLKPLGLAHSDHKIQDLDNLSEFDHILVNAAGASGPDVIQPLSADAADRFFGAGQTKNFAQVILSKKLFEAERAKAGADEHFFMAITSGKVEPALLCALPDNAAIVDEAKYMDYFGPFAFRMLKPDIDLHSSSVLTLMQIEGVGRAIAEAIVSHRGVGYKKLEDLEQIVDNAGKRLPEPVLARLGSLLAREVVG